jgi:phage terminase large subunit GpA-like protein
MDACTDPNVHTVVDMKSSQVGGTETLLNVIGYYIDQEPSPIICLQPTLDMGKTFSTKRLAPMLRDTPKLKGRVKDARSRDGSNTVLEKSFPGGYVAIVGTNSPSSLASRPVRIVLCDEVDRYPIDAKDEGDPIALAIVRSKRFWNRKAILVSTPTVKGLSRIERAYEASDKRQYWIPCPDCDEPQVLKWAQVKWPEGKPEEAAYCCEFCGTIWNDAARWRAIAGATKKGHGWKAEKPFNGIAGFRRNELMSQWVKLRDVVQNFLEAKRSPETLKTWVNTSLGETWESDAERLDAHAFSERLEDWGPREDFGHIAPLGVLVVTAGVDVQADRFEVERLGTGIDEETWSLDHHVIMGDPSNPEMWRQLDAYLQTPTIRVDGRELPVRTTCIDSGGHHTQAVYKFCRMRRSRRVFAVKGRDEALTIWPHGLKAKKGRQSDVTIVGVSVAKDAVYARLRVRDAGPGFCHFPKGRSPIWFEQLVSEVVETRHSFGRARRVYVLPQGRRNEALDCRVYAYAALQSLSIRWGTELMAANAAPVGSVPRETPAPEVIAKVQERRSPLPPRKPGGGNPFASKSWFRK